MQPINPIIEERWKEILWEEFQSSYFSDLKKFLVEEKKNHTIYPPGNLIFNAFKHTPFDELKAVILGQDPYHGTGQAHGLCFSVPPGIRQPPSLVNIFKELHSDLDIPIPQHGNLENWADQGIMLLNATLSVRAGQAGSHQNKGWETFTNRVIEVISAQKSRVVFLLWGKYAQAKESLIDGQKHLVLKAAHPSPFSAHNGFMGCKHFSKTNAYLEQQGIPGIDWRL
ncbi:MAG: uracil-DNA glycosylase [Bacteroidetes bacterium]|nr:MAG: uracil-DNA glycosylase [Bacteroidota bacterium]